MVNGTYNCNWLSTRIRQNDMLEGTIIILVNKPLLHSGKLTECFIYPFQIFLINMRGRALQCITHVVSQGNLHEAYFLNWPQMSQCTTSTKVKFKTKGFWHWENCCTYANIKTSFVGLFCWCKIWAASSQNQQCDCAPSEDSDQPGHPPSLIRVFAVRSMGS